MKNKILGILLAVLMVVSVFALSGCEALFPVESPTDENEESYRAIYQLYVEYAENNGEEPEDYEAWLEEIRGEDGKDGKDGKDGQDAVAPRLRINEKNNHWEISTDGGLTWKNLGVKATGNDGANGIDGKDGVSPHIGENGNWWIGNIDTEITAKGESGSKGEDGEDGITPQLRIVDGYWEVSYDNGETWMSLGVAATGPKGDKGDQGEKGEDGKDGQDGENGKTPYVQDGYWYIDGVNTGVKAEGVDGEDLTACEHSFGEWIVVYAPTCESIGVNYRTCEKCNAVEHSYVEKLGHTLVDVYTIVDSCTDYKVMTMCSVCSSAHIDIREPHGHNYIDGNCEHCCVTSDEYFVFYPQIYDTYSIRAKDVDNMPSNVVIPSTHNGQPVTSIGYTAFSGCSSLTSITISDSVTSIGYMAFYNCSSLTSITIPDSVTSIGDLAFYNCDSLTSITVDENNQYYKSIDGNLYTKDGTTLIQYAIGKEDTAFVIPDSVTSIGNRAFYNCDSLTSITIGNGVTSIGEGAFEGCSSLTSITIPDSVTSIGNWAFYNCDSLTSVTIGNSVTSIGFRAFDGCDSLYVIYNNSTFDFEIGSEENGYIAKYAKMIISPEATIYANDEYTYSLTDDGFLFRCKDSKYELIAYAGGKETVMLPENINDSPYDIYKMRGVVNVIITNSVTSIGNWAFCNCDSLTSITIPDSVTSIGDYAFSSCSSLTSVTIGNSVTSIGSGAFYYCDSLTSITIPDSVTSIGEDAFYYCSSLTSITIPDSVTSIGRRAFYYCKSLTSITVDENNQYYKSIDGNLYTKDGTTLIQYAIGKEDTAFVIPDSVTSIGNSAFAWCRSLTSITIPNSVTSIGSYAFFSCSSLTSVTIGNSVTSIGSGAFEYCSSLTSITVDENNQYYKSIDENLYSKDGKTLIQYAIGKEDTAFVIPDSVTSIGSGAFYYCDSLTSITIPDSVTSIGYGAFEGCSSLTSITIPDSVTSIGNWAFYNCDSLTSITIPDSVISIGDDAFAWCDSLTSITIPDSVTSIGEWAFYGCSSLTDVYYTGTEEQWAEISIGSYNSYLTNATIHYNYVPEE